MIWIVSAGIVLVIAFTLYSCVVAGAKADRNMKEIMKNVRKRE